MTGESPRVSVVIPAYNEGDHIIPVLDRIFESVRLQCEVLVEPRKTKEALEGGLLHLLDVAEAHVVFDERENLVAIFVGEAKAAQDCMGDLHADLDVAWRG